MLCTSAQGAACGHKHENWEQAGSQASLTCSKPELGLLCIVAQAAAGPWGAEEEFAEHSLVVNGPCRHQSRVAASSRALGTARQCTCLSVQGASDLALQVAGCDQALFEEKL